MRGDSCSLVLSPDFWRVRSMTRITGHSHRVLRGVQGGEPLRFRRVRFMAARAEHAGIGQHRLDGPRVVSMLGLRPVAGLAIYSSMFPGLLLFENVDVAGFASFMAGMDNW